MRYQRPSADASYVALASSKRVLRGPSSNPYCVPAALSVVTGLHVDVVCQLIRNEIGDQQITGIFYPLVLKILGKLGYSYKEDFKIENSEIYLIHFNGHLAAAAEGRFFDNFYPTGTNLGMIGKRRIEKIFRVWKET